MKIYNLYDKEICNEDVVSKIYAYYATEWFGYAMLKPHKHSWMEIMYVANGKCTVEFEGYTIQMRKGEFIFIDAHVSHRLVLEQTEPCRILNLEFGFESCSSVQLPIGNMIRSSEHVKKLIEQKQTVIHIKNFEEIQPILQSLVYELNSEAMNGTYLAQLMVLELLIVMSRRGCVKDHEMCCQNFYVQKAIKYIDDYFDTSIKVSDIANEVNIHTSYLHRIFKKHTCMTISEYLVGIRIKKSKMLLEKTDVPVIDLCGYVGFGSRQYFSYVFKKHTGLSPANYRKSCKAKAEILI